MGFGTQRSLPSLDGLRAVSIALVLVAHLTGTKGFLNFHPLMALGVFGVRVFFVISGYLITTILVKEWYRDGDIALPRFYFRRILRLFPACYAIIGVTAFLASEHIVQLERWDLLSGATYTMNFYPGHGWALGHLWSLAVEEQFYLVWPLMLSLLGPKKSIRWLGGVLCVAPLFRLLSPYFSPYFNFIIWSDALATGCLLSLLHKELSRHPVYMRIQSSRWFFLVPALAFALIYTPSTKVSWLISETLMNVSIAMSIDWAMRYPASRVGQFLNLPAVGFPAHWDPKLRIPRGQVVAAASIVSPKY